MNADEEQVRARYPTAHCVRGHHPYPRGPIRYRIKYSHDPRVYGCKWCGSEERAWKAARARMVNKILRGLDE